MVYEIKNEILSAKIDSYGAQLVSVKLNEIEKLWQNDDGKWNESAPVLFPLCGKIGFVYNGKMYDITPHGFAKDKQFKLVNLETDSLSLSLSYDSETIKVYPFKFEFVIRYSISGNNLQVQYQVKNIGDNSLYYSIGGHESFALDDEIENYKVVFSEKGYYYNLINDVDAYLLGGKELITTDGEINLKEEYFKDGISLIFSNLSCHDISLYKKEKLLAKVSFEDFDTLLLWKEPFSRFICIEPWLNIPDSYDNINVSIDKKYGFIRLEPKCEKTISQQITYYE